MKGAANKKARSGCFGLGFSVFRARPWNDVVADIHRGEDILSRYNVDVLLVDPQRMPDNAVNFPGKNPAIGNFVTVGPT